MNKLISKALILGLILGISAILVPPIIAPPPIGRPNDLYEITIQGGNPQSIDYSWAYDTESAEIIQNTMDTLLMWNTESTTPPYLFTLATSEIDGAVTSGVSSIGCPVPSGDSVSGLNFENTGQPGPSATYYWQYDFKIRQGVEFQPPYNYALTTEDVAYSFQRTLFQDRTAGPQWMLDEALLDNAGGLSASATGGLMPGPMTSSNPLAGDVGALVRDAVQYNATDVWFNVMFPGAYAPFLQILCGTWASIESKQWINNQVIMGAGRPDWDGSFTSLTAWTATWNPAVSPLDSPTPMEYGSGAFTLTPGTPDYTHNEWAATRNLNWWGGCPTSYPVEAGAAPAGYTNTIEVSWNYAWSAAQGFFKSGDCDFVELPFRGAMTELYQNGATGSYYPYPSSSTNLPLAGIRCFAPLYTDSVDALLFTFNVTPGIYSGTIYPPVTGAVSYPSGDGGGIPSNFFGGVAGQVNSFGIDMRKAFAYSIDYSTELAVALAGEGSIPATAILPGLYGYDSSVTGYSYNLATAAQYFNMWPGLMSTGFTITLYCNTGNGERQELCTLLQTAIQSINPKFVINVVNIDWATFLFAAASQGLSCFVTGWQPDFLDTQNFAYPFYHTGGALASWQLYSNPTMDALIDQAVALPAGSLKLSCYSQIQQLVIQDCPSVTILQPIDRHFERDWVQEYYYNPTYPSARDTDAGHNFFNEYKFYYPPESNQPTQSQPFSEYLPADVNRDGMVNMKDIASIARAFGSSYTQPIPINWVFVDDLTNDRTINMKDIAFVARQFGMVSPIGTFGPLVTITPITSVVSTGSSIKFTATVDAFHGYAPGRVIQWYYGTLANGAEGPPTAGGTGSTWAWPSIPAGSSYVYCTVTDNFAGSSYAAARLAAGLLNIVTVESMHVGIYAT